MTQPGSDRDGVGDDGMISLSAVTSLLRVARVWIAIGAVVGAGAALGVSFLMTPKYRAEAVVVPVSNTDTGGGLSGLLSQFGGAASLVGLGGGGDDQKAESMAVLNSRAIAEKFIIGHKLVQEFAKKGSFGNPPRSDADRMVEAVKFFRKSVLMISEDRRANTVTISMQWKDPALAAAWTNDFLNLVNEDLRQRAITQAQTALGYLTRETADTTILEVRETLSRLIEGQHKSISMAKSRQDYAFRAVDPATVPARDDFVSPNRPLMLMGGAIFGALLGAGFVALRRKT